MAIQYINTGTIANDGTGDDLRESFTKINDNFEELDLRIVEETQIENLGSIGQGVWGGKVDGVHGFKRLVAGTNINVTSTANTITINASDSLDQLVVVSDNGTLTVARGQTMRVRGGDGIVTSVSGQDLTVTLDDAGIVVKDLTPSLGGDLNANNKNITGANTISANNFSGSLQGLVYGYDVREFGPYLSGFDFGGIRNSYNNALEFIMNRVDLDFAAITPASGDNVDLGFI